MYLEGRIAEIRAYNETDAVTTHLLMLRLAHLPASSPTSHTAASCWPWRSWSRRRRRGGKAQFAEFWTAWKGAGSGTAVRGFAVDSGAVTVYFGSNEFSRNLCRQQAEDIRPTSARLLMIKNGRQIRAQSGFHCSGLATNANPLQSSISPTRNDPLLSRLPMHACMR